MWMNRLNWPYLSDYLAAGREIWMVDGIIAGYRQASHGLANIAVNNAGHMVCFLFVCFGSFFFFLDIHFLF